MDPNRDQAISSIIVREKYIFSTAYGALAGISFAIAMYAWDAYQLSQSHAFFPWLKLTIGILLCALVGGLTGWLVARKERGCLGFLFWLVAAVLFSLITVSLPLQIMPFVAKLLDPQLSGYLQFDIGNAYVIRFWIAMVWILIFLSITGILQSTLIESAVFSISLFGKIAPFLVCMLLMGIGGVVLDDLINVPFRGAIFSVETPIQFILDNRGKQVDPEESRKNHAGAFGSVVGEVTAERKVIVSGYDESFGRINVLIQFENAWVDCTTVNNQASYCKLAVAKE